MLYVSVFQGLLLVIVIIMIDDSENAFEKAALLQSLHVFEKRSRP